MFVYDFKNIHKIKNLKHGSYDESDFDVLEKNISNTVFADFDYKHYKRFPPPVNESVITMQELIKLSDFKRDDEFTYRMDKISKSFESLCGELDLDFPDEKVDEFLIAAGYVVLYLKKYFNRPRPYDLAKEYGIQLGENKLKYNTMDSAAYPSGHATQSTLIANFFARLYPQHKSQFLKLGNDISYSRLMARLHYPSDVEFGKRIGIDMFNYVKVNKFI